jgi:lysophospholipase L1-like esterase
MRRLLIIFALLITIVCLITVYSHITAKNFNQSYLGLQPDSVSSLIIEPTTNSEEFKPRALTNYPREAPSPTTLVLRWTIPPGSIYFEIEFLTKAPENPNGTSPSIYRFFSSRNVFTNGYIIDLPTYSSDHLYWRVRGLDLEGNPVGDFSDATAVYFDGNLPQILKPVSNTGYSEANMPMPLYPVYSWIPIYGAVAYEVELTSAPPENPDKIAPSKYRLRNHIVKGPYDYYFEFYDQTKLITPGTYYWRVRGLDKTGGPVGVFSDAEKFTVSYESGSYAATFGDSTTQGGGDMIYSPANVVCDYRTYLSFSTMNLGRSGDNTGGMLARFESDVLPFHPEYLIILGGIPDLTMDVPAAQVIYNLAAIRDKCLLHGVRPVFLTLYPVNSANIKKTDKRVIASNWQKNFATVNAFLRQQEYCIDIEPYFLDADHNLPTYLSVDGIHLGIEGKKLMAKVINNNWLRVTQ